MAVKETVLRFVVVHEAGRYEARCVDAAATGYGDTIADAVSDLTDVIQTLADVARERKARFIVEPDPDDEMEFRIVSRGRPMPGVVAYGNIAGRTASRKHKPSAGAFDVSNLVGVA